VAIESFIDSGPKGRSFSFQGNDYHISPSILSGRAMRAIRRKIAQLQREELMSFLRSDPPLPDAVRQQLIDKYDPDAMITFRAIAIAAQNPEVLATMLHVACEELTSFEQALALVDDYPNYIELMGFALDAADLLSLGNSNSPDATDSDPGTLKDERPSS